MISKANKPSGYSHSVSRLNYLNSKDNSTVGASKDCNPPMLMVTDESAEGDPLDKGNKDGHISTPRINQLANEKVMVQEKNYTSARGLEERVENAQLPTDSKLQLSN